MIPNLITTEFSLDNCGDLVTSAREAYAPEGEASTEQLARSLGADRFKWIKNEETDTQLFIVRRGNVVVVSFAGTQNIHDWLTDLECWLSTCWMSAPPGCNYKAHRGFGAALNSVWGELIATVKEWVSPLGILFLTGHSLGGGLALLAAQRLNEQDCRPFAVYTFGAPRPGDKAFYDAYSTDGLADRTYNVQHNADIVPFVPFLHWGYRRPGKRVFFDALSVPHFKVSLWAQMLSEAAGIWYQWRHRHGLAPIKDHFISAYMRMVADAMRSKEARIKAFACDILSTPRPAGSPLPFGGVLQAVPGADLSALAAKVETLKPTMVSTNVKQGPGTQLAGFATQADGSAPLPCQRFSSFSQPVISDDRESQISNLKSQIQLNQNQGGGSNVEGQARVSGDEHKTSTGPRSSVITGISTDQQAQLTTPSATPAPTSAN